MDKALQDAMKLCPKCKKEFSDDANFCPVDAARLTAAMAPLAGADTLAAKYELGDKVGGTRTGAVHRATDKATGAKVVVKLVAPEVLALPGVAQRLERELKQLERVQSTSVAKILGSGKRGDQTWIAMELLDGAHTLAASIGTHGGIPLEQASPLVEVIGEALIEAAQVGVVHRDLAPKNVLFAGQDIKLVNFSLPVPGDKVAGVPEFAAPEQQDGKPVDQRSNIYSLGAIYYYLVTGKPPEAGNIKPPSQLANVPANVEAVIMRALDKSPTKRFLTVRQFVDEVGRLATKPEAPFDPKATAALGKAGKPKAMIVETLLGVREGMLAGKSGAIASAPTVGEGIPALAPSAPAAGSTGTTVGLAGGADPVTPAAGSDRSPWAPPAAEAPKAPVVAAPVVVIPDAPKAPVVPAAPVIAAPVAAKKKAPDEEPKKSKGKFRETMWFKKGELDSETAVKSAEERERTGKGGADKADSLPVDERYKDDGSITRADKEKYSLRTGGTMMQASIKDGGGGTSSNVSEDALIGEMKQGRSWIIVAIALGVVGIGIVVYLIAS